MAPPTKEELEEITERLKAEGPIRMGQAAAEFGCSIDSVMRYITKGKGGVRLEAFLETGGGWRTSKAAITRFQAELTWRALQRFDDAGRQDTPKQRETRAQAAGRELLELIGE